MEVKEKETKGVVEGMEMEEEKEETKGVVGALGGGGGDEWCI